MGMKKCKECGEEISSDAKACPKCGKDSRNFFKKHTILCVIGIIIVILTISVAGSDNEADSKNTLSASSENSQTITEVKKKEYNVGEIYEDSDIAVKYVSKNENFTNISKYAEVKSGYKVIQATFEFENVGASDAYVYSGDFNCYADGYSCEEFYYIDDLDDSSFGTTLSSGKKTKGNVYFEVPKDVKEITIEYEVDVWSSEKIVFVVK